MVSTEQHGTVAVVTLGRGVTNALNHDLLNEFTRVLRGLRQDENVRGLVLTSSNHKFFSIGFDIPHLLELARADFADFYHTFNRLSLELYALPKPTVAAITGHAIAGGCILALCCDYRYIGAGKKLMGLNEIKLGVPVPYPVDCILRRLVGDRAARDVMESGDFYDPEQSRCIGMVDGVLPVDEVLSASVEKAETLGRMPSDAFAVIKRNRVEGVEETVRSRLIEKERAFIECWFAHDAQRLLTKASEKF